MNGAIINVLYFDFARKTYKIGGGQIYIKQMVNFLDRKRFKPFIYSLSDSGIFVDLRDVTVIPRHSDYSVLEKFDSHGLKRLLSIVNIVKLMHWIIYESVALHTIINKYHIRLIHINGMLPLIITVLSGSCLKVRTVYHVHHVINSYIGRLILNFLCLFIDKIICVSKYVKEKSFFVQQFKNIVIYNGVLVDDIGGRIKDRQKQILFVGNMLRCKGHEEFIKAIYLIHTLLEEFGYEIYLYGDGEEKEHIRALISKYQLNKLIFFKGFSNNVRDRMKESRILVNASIEPEAFGLTVVEGMAAGCIVIASEYGGIKEIVNEGENGFLVNPKKINMMSNKILYVVEHYDDLKTLISYAEENVKNKFNIRKNIRQIEKVYEELER